MKKILNEWKRFVINESNQPFIDKELGAKFNGEWFGMFDYYLGLIQGMVYYPLWKNYLDEKYPKIESDLKTKAKSAEIFYKKIYGGESYYVDRFLEDDDVEKLIGIKVKGYIENAPKDQVEFFLSNMERILEYGGENEKPHSKFNGSVAFFARPTDWWMFGNGFEKTKQAFTFAKANYEDLSNLPGASEPEAELPEPISNAADERTSGTAANVSKFFSDNPEALKQKRTRRSRK
tara:strand:- start:1607 stop:2308 length:702 start_codon:yes stop_codon:yes gene_type:complete